MKNISGSSQNSGKNTITPLQPAQTVIFGCGLVIEESEDAFKWLFSTFLKAVEDKHPVGILTDQNRAMELAIKAVLPNTIHRWCKWHIFYKAKEHIGPNLYSKTSDFKDKFHRVLNHTRTIDEFEGAWNSLIAEYDLHSNTWLQDVWDKRDRWAPPYFKDFFFAKMTTTQRSECMNHVLKAYVSPSSTMHNFVKQYDKFIADRIAAEDKLEFDTSKDARQPRCGSPIERKAAKVYTDTMFAKFSDQVMMHIGCRNLPDKYIKKRWTSNAREGNKSRFNMHAAASRTHRHTLLFEACMDLSSKGDASVDAYHVAMRKITEALQEIRLMPTQEDATAILQVHTTSTHLSAESDDECANEMEDEDILEAQLHDDVLPPNRRKKRGRPRTARLKSAAEGGVRTKRKCSFCQEKGHYRTGCPQNPENLTKSKINKVCKKCQLPGHNTSTCGDPPLHT
ncbi:protein FAR-RED IMPAIRED RESPONSE 1-like [Aegilops tauschii subsp. strangulata]|uniref:protein FAR-RED IMPAIRED RESPONSE 1-like n=1 Tax=Aegilops tauschii subsp. strangulata TaxID=200361 RepID=UPI003CC860B2